MVVTQLEETAGVRAVIFDFGGVIAEEGFRDGLMEIARRHGLDPEAFYRRGADAVYESGFVTGRGSESDFWNLMRRYTPIRGDDDELSGEILKRFVVRPRMIGAVRSLRMLRYRTAILSDQTGWLDRLDGIYGFYREFDRVYNSFFMGKGKRDPTFFDDAVRDLGLEPRWALFLDDQEENVKRAAERGLQAVLFRDQEHFIAGIAHLMRRRTVAR